MHTSLYEWRYLMLLQAISARGHCYVTSSGVYFDTQAFGPAYGKLYCQHNAIQSDDDDADKVRFLM